MGLLGFLKRKKEDDFGFEDLDRQIDETPEENSSLENNTALSNPLPNNNFNDEGFRPAFSNQHFAGGSSDFGDDKRLIISQLELINKKLDVMDKRLEDIEKIAK